MNTMMQQLVNMSGEYISFDIEGKLDQKIKIVGAFDNPYFCGKDACTILEHKNMKSSLFKLDPDYKKDLKTIMEEVVSCGDTNSIIGIPNLKPSYNEGKEIYINEPGLYALIMKSKTHFAKTFQKFVYEQILPSIRKRGRFQLEQTIALKDDKIDELSALVKRMDMKIEGLVSRNDELLENGHDLKDQNNELLDTSDQQTDQLQTIQHKLGIAVKDRAPLPRQKNKQERFVLIKRTQKRNGSKPEHMYYTIRSQDPRAKQSLRAQETMYNIEILLDLTCHPNSKTLYNRIKDDLIEKSVVFSYNNISIKSSEIDENMLIACMKKIDEKKLNV